MLQWARNTADRLSDCHLNKQRLINPLEAEVNESVWLIESMGVTPPYKISRFHRESLLGQKMDLRYPRAYSGEPNKRT